MTVKESSELSKELGMPEPRFVSLKMLIDYHRSFNSLHTFTCEDQKTMVALSNENSRSDDSEVSIDLSMLLDELCSINHRKEQIIEALHKAYDELQNQKQTGEIDDLS